MAMYFKRIIVFVLSFCGTFFLYAQQSSIDWSGFEYVSQGTLYTTDKDSLKGLIRFNFAKNNLVVLQRNGKDVSYEANNVEGFKLNQPVKKFISASVLASGGTKIFYEDITTRGNKLRLLKTFFAETAGGNVKIKKGKPAGYWDYSLYNVARKEIYTGYKKIADHVRTDCPALANKIVQKQPGYFGGLSSNSEETLAIFTRIVNEYNNCQ